MAASMTTTTFFFLTLALLSLSQGPALCSARRHDCLRVDFKPNWNGSAPMGSPKPYAGAPAPHRGGRDADTMRMPFCGGSFWVSLNTTQLLEDVACPPSPAPAPAPAGHGKKSSLPAGGAHGSKALCTSRWEGDGYEVIVSDFKAMEKSQRKCSNWVEAPTRTSRHEKVLVCADCPADTKKKSHGRKDLAISITITIVIKF